MLRLFSLQRFQRSLKEFWRARAIRTPAWLSPNIKYMERKGRRTVKTLTNNYRRHLVSFIWSVWLALENTFSIFTETFTAADSWRCIFYNPVHCRWKHIHPQEQKIHCDSYGLYSPQIIELRISLGHKVPYYSGLFFSCNISHVFFSFPQFRWKCPSHNLHNNAALIPGTRYCVLCQAGTAAPILQMGSQSHSKPHKRLPHVAWAGETFFLLSLLWVPHTVMRIHARPLPRMDRGILQDVGSGAGSLEGTRVKGPRVTAALHPQTPGKALKRETCTAQEFTGHTGEFERGQGRNFHLLILP